MVVVSVQHTQGNRKMARRRSPIGLALGNAFQNIGSSYGNRMTQDYEKENQLELLRNILSEPRRLSVDSSGAGQFNEQGQMQGVGREIGPLFSEQNAPLLSQMNPQFLNILSMVAQENQRREPKTEYTNLPQGADLLGITSQGGKFAGAQRIATGQPKMDSTEPTQLKKLQDELAGIQALNPADPRIPQYKQRIQRELEGVQSFLPFMTDQGVVPFQTRRGTFGEPTDVYKATPTEVKQQLASLDDNLKSIEEIRGVVGRSNIGGPVTGRARKLGSRFFSDPDAQRLISLAGQLRTVIYGLSGKQINESEQKWLETEILPNIMQPDENFDVTIDVFEDWVNRRKQSIGSQFPGLGAGKDDVPPEPVDNNDPLGILGK